MSDFLKEFSNYQDCVPPGVLLPEIDIDQRHYDDLDVSSDISNFDFLRALCLKGSKDKGIGMQKNKQEYYDRVKKELSILDELGFVDYVLLNWDILNYCHENNIPTGPGRGSAAGSLVLYLIGVTQVDPVKYGLFFERFVSKSRARKTERNGLVYLDGSLLADVDNDIAYEHRQKVIDYIEKKHPNRTAKILTLNKLSGKLCIKECGKIVGELSEQDVNLVSDYIPKKFGKIASLSAAYEESEKFKLWADSNPQVYNVALKLEGLIKNTGVHPSGIAISHLETSSLCPLQLTNEGALVTGYDMNWVAELMVKFDILGLRTLSVIQDTCNQLGILPEDIDLTDQSLYEPLNSLESPHGLFQIEAHTNYRVCKKIKPKTLDQLSAVVAIARPGAIEFLDQYALYAIDSEFQSQNSFFDDILMHTGGIPLYQEQLMQMAVKVGFTLDESEQLRRIVGKKKVDQMPAWKKKIEQKVEDNALNPEVGEFLWKVAQDSANYSFNKSHSLCYATLAAWTTHLKFKHPKEFFLSLLKMTRFEPSPQEEIRRVSQELGRFGIKLLSPDLVLSKMEFSIEDNNIRYGLNSIKGVSEKTFESLCMFREKDKPNKYDVFSQAKESGINIGTLSSLIQAGALSSYNTSRCYLVAEAHAYNILTDREKRNVRLLGEKYSYDALLCIRDILLDAERDTHKIIADDGKPIMKKRRSETFRKKWSGYKTIFQKNKKFESFANWYFERKLLGYSYSTTLKDSMVDSEGRLKTSEDFNDLLPRSRGKFIGVVEDFLKRKSVNGNQYYKIVVSDEYGTFQAMLIDNRRFPRYSDYESSGKPWPEKDNIIVMTGSKGEDILFMDDMDIVDHKIYMKLSDLKEKTSPDFNLS
tara:strand:+ start:12502 stop:15111 length:2610 start_codon:yes stop_codon:yes gene_type:complete